MSEFGRLHMGQCISATFLPRRRDDLKPGVAALIGKRGTFEALWLIDHDENYAGQWAMKVPDGWRSGEMISTWVPEEDLAVE